MKNLFVVIAVMFAVVLTGCATSNTTSRVGVPEEEAMAGVALKATGNVTVVEERTSTTFQSAKSLSAAKLELALAREQTKQVEAMARARAAEARAANPCSSWFMAPSYCYGNTVSGGGVTVVGSGGHNHYYFNGGGVTTGTPPGGSTGGVTITQPGGTNHNF